MGGGYTDYIVNQLIGSFGIFVQLFFIISGFGMCCGYYEKVKNNQIDLNSFYNKRYAKILPFFALLTFLDLGASLILDGAIGIGSIYEAFANLTLMFGFYTVSGMSVIGVGWTLGVIFGFYILFPFFVYLIWTKERAWFSLAVTIAITYISAVYFGTKGSLTFTAMCYLVAGGLIYLYRDTIADLIKNKAVGIAITLVGFTIVFFVKIPIGGDTAVLVSTVKMIIGFGLMVIGALGEDTKLWCNPMTRFISSVSLEVYLAHMLVFRAIQKVGLTQIAGQSVTSYAFACVLTIVGVLIFASGYQWVEKWIRRRLHVA